MNRQELELETEHTDLLEALDAAKESYNGEEVGPSQKALKDAEWALEEFRIKWRTIAEQFAPQNVAAGTAAPETAQVSVVKDED